jgi:hypothetical protein
VRASGVLSSLLVLVRRATTTTAAATAAAAIVRRGGGRRRQLDRSRESRQGCSHPRRVGRETGYGAR